MYIKEVLCQRELNRDQEWSGMENGDSEYLNILSQKFKKLIHPIAGQWILDFGCGKGYFSGSLGVALSDLCSVTAMSLNGIDSKPHHIPHDVEFINLFRNPKKRPVSPWVTSTPKAKGTTSSTTRSSINKALSLSVSAASRAAHRMISR